MLIYCVFGNLMPRARDGKFQDNAIENAFINRIAAFIKLGAIPESMQYSHLEFTPIDKTAEAIITLVTHPNTENRIFHLFNHNFVYLNKCLKYFKTINKSFKLLQDDDFTKLVKSTLNDKNRKEILSFLINDIDKNLHFIYNTNIIVQSESTINYLYKIGFKWSYITDKYLIRFLELLRSVM